MQFHPFFLPRTPHTQLQSLSLSLKIKAEKRRNRKSKNFSVPQKKHTKQIIKKERKKARPSLLVQPLSISPPILLFSQNTFSKNKNNNRFTCFPSLQIPSSPQILCFSLSLSIRPSFLLFPKKLTFYYFFFFDSKFGFHIFIKMSTGELLSIEPIELKFPCECVFSLSLSLTDLFLFLFLLFFGFCFCFFDDV